MSDRRLDLDLHAGSAVGRRTPGWRAAFGATLALAMIAATFTQFVLGPLAPFLVPEMGLSRPQLGTATTMLFLAAGIGSPLAGRLVGVLGVRRALVTTLLLAALAPVLMALAPSLSWLLAAVTLGGLTSALSNPVTNALLREHVERGRQGLLVGVKQSGVQLGAFLAGATLPALAAVFGWRVALASAGVLGILALPAAAIVVPPDAPQARQEREDSSPLSGPVNLLAGYAFLMGLGTATLSTFLPLYAVERVGVAAAIAGFTAGLIGLFGAAARIVWSHAVERGLAARPVLALLASGACAALLLIAAAVGQPALVFVGAALFGLTGGAWNAVAMLTVVRSGADVGRASGRVLAGFYLGFIVSPVAFGAFTEADPSRYPTAWCAVAATYAVAAVLPLIRPGRHPGGGSGPAASGQHY